MKTINVSDEDYTFLVEAQKLLLSQDNRCTSDPIYCIYKKEKVWGMDSDYSDDYEWIWDDSTFTTEELFDLVQEEHKEELVKLYLEDIGMNINEIDLSDLSEVVSDSDLKKWFSDLNEYTLQDWLKEHSYDSIHKVYYNEVSRLDEHSNVFSFFEKDAIEYVKSKCYGVDIGSDDNVKNKNDYNIWSYCASNYRTYRMNKLRKILIDMKLE